MITAPIMVGGAATINKKTHVCPKCGEREDRKVVCASCGHEYKSEFDIIGFMIFAFIFLLAVACAGTAIHFLASVIFDWNTHRTLVDSVIKNWNEWWSVLSNIY